MVKMGEMGMRDEEKKVSLFDKMEGGMAKKVSLMGFVGRQRVKRVEEAERRVVQTGERLGVERVEWRGSRG